MTDTDTEAETDIKIEKPKTSTGTLLQVFIGLVWLGTSMYTAHVTITKSGDLSGTLGDAAEALPGVVASTLVTGASIASAASSRFGNALLRLLIGLGTGALFGVVAGVAIRWAYGADDSIMVLAITVAASSVVGGALAILPNEVLEAALWATTWVFFVGVMSGVWALTLLDVVGGETNFAYVMAALAGLFAAGYSAQSLRGQHRLWYPVAAAVPGLILLAAEALTRFGGSSVISIIEGVAPDQPELADLNDSSRLQHALLVLAIGVVVSLLFALFRKKDA